MVLKKVVNQSNNNIVIILTVLQLTLLTFLVSSSIITNNREALLSKKLDAFNNISDGIRFIHSNSDDIKQMHQDFFLRYEKTQSALINRIENLQFKTMDKIDSVHSKTFEMLTNLDNRYLTKLDQIGSNISTKVDYIQGGLNSNLTTLFVRNTPTSDYTAYYWLGGVLICVLSIYFGKRYISSIDSISYLWDVTGLTKAQNYINSWYTPKTEDLSIIESSTKCTTTSSSTQTDFFEVSSINTTSNTLIQTDIPVEMLKDSIGTAGGGMVEGVVNIVLGMTPEHIDQIRNNTLSFDSSTQIMRVANPIPITPHQLELAVDGLMKPCSINKSSEVSQVATLTPMTQEQLNLAIKALMTPSSINKLTDVAHVVSEIPIF